MRAILRAFLRPIGRRVQLLRFFLRCFRLRHLRRTRCRRRMQHLRRPRRDRFELQRLARQPRLLDRWVCDRRLFDRRLRPARGLPWWCRPANRPVVPLLAERREPIPGSRSERRRLERAALRHPRSGPVRRLQPGPRREPLLPRRLRRGALNPRTAFLLTTPGSHRLHRRRGRGFLLSNSRHAGTCTYRFRGIIHGCWSISFIFRFVRMFPCPTKTRSVNSSP
jgi:hypothetical protein